MTIDTEDPFLRGLPTIEAGRVRLRALALDDAPGVYRLYADREANRFGYSPPMDTLDDARVVIEKTIDLAQKRQTFHFGVADREGDQVIGHTTLFQWNREQRRAEVGYSIRRDLWGRGLGTEAAGALVAFAFERLDLRRLEADVDPRNEGSRRVLEKLGFVREGLCRERWELQGELQDGVLFGLLRREWRGASAR